MTSSRPEIFVDLGNVSDARPDPEPAPSWNLARLPRIVLLLVAVIAPLLLGSAAPGPRPQLIQVAEVVVGPNAQVLVNGDRLYVDSYDLRNTLVAYDLQSRRQLWESNEIEQPGQNMIIVDGTIVSSSYNAVPGSTNTESFDAVTGRQLWTSESGSAVPTAHGTLVQAPVSAATPQSWYANPAEYQMLDARSGRMLWSLETPDGCVTTLSGAPLPTRLVEACPASGTLRVLDLADGHTLAQRSAPLGGAIDPASDDPSAEMGEPQLVVVDTTLLIGHANVPVPTVDAYVLDTLTTRWGGVAEQFAQAITACGDQVCFYQTPDIGLRVDVMTGASLGPADPLTLDSASTDGTFSLVGTDGGAAAVVTSPAGAAVAIQPDGTGPVWLARPPDRLIAPLRGAGRASCTQIAAYLACATTDNRIRVWALPS